MVYFGPKNLQYPPFNLASYFVFMPNWRPEKDKDNTGGKPDVDGLGVGDGGEGLLGLHALKRWESRKFCFPIVQPELWEWEERWRQVWLGLEFPRGGSKSCGFLLLQKKLLYKKLGGSRNCGFFPDFSLQQKIFWCIIFSDQTWSRT